MGLIANVYRSGRIVQALTAKNAMQYDDCTINGWSSRFDRVCVINAQGPFNPDYNCPAVMIRRHRSMPALHVISVEHFESKVWTMMGGNFLHSSDSRFREACNDILCYGNDWPNSRDKTVYNIPAHMGLNAIPIHDRVE